VKQELSLSLDSVMQVSYAQVDKQPRLPLESLINLATLRLSQDLALQVTTANVDLPSLRSVLLVPIRTRSKRTDAKIVLLELTVVLLA
jgi:hypothetical protein